ncbi:Uncharacterised protein [Candidatus Bilamarchaeum dharawalense]|uniref:Uncharacterized protein n=1 Tax=Candidatus Bilamarchaeum dharawalense TaxID=2885759 RepID=A0A5E4LXK9_9ARCH|nr:Uncharacterised protein [Candidatus Bilamarchaeum dharawalense]
MPEMSAKIKKKAYRFEIKKKYQYVSRYKTIDRPPIEKIKDMVRKLLTPKKEEKKEKAPVFSDAPPPGGFNFVVFGAFLLIALIVLGVAWIYITTQIIGPGGWINQAELEKPAIDNSIMSGEVLTTGQKNAPQNIAAIRVEYKTTNLKNYTVDVTTYKEKISTEVFVLNSERFEAESYPDFLRTLRTNLGKRKIMLNEISIRQLETLPQGAIVIVPSGVIPKEMLGFDSLITMDKLSSRGIVVIYMGQPFTKMLNGTLVTQTPSSVVKALPVTFDESNAITTGPEMHVYQPLYTANSFGKWTPSILYGSISIIKKENGAFIFFPQTLDGGWRGNYTSAADDVAKIIFDTSWAEKTSGTRNYLFENSTGYNGTRYFFSEPYTQDNTTVKIEFTGYSETSEYPIKEMLFARVNSQDTNDLYIESGGKVISTNITDQPARMNALLHESQPAQPSMSLIIEDINGNEVQNLPQGNVNVQADRSFDIRIYLDKGEYIVRLIDEDGKEYARTYMRVITPEITHIGNDRQKQSIYIFSVTMDGAPTKLPQISVKVDGGKFGEYTFSSESTLYVDVGRYTGNEILPLGEDHIFEFTSGKLVKKVAIPHPRKQSILESPVVWLVLLFTGGMLGIGTLFARQDAIYYSIDIPDFPAVAKTKVSLPADVVLGVLDKINENYRWQNTPLTPSEIKSGFKNVLTQGKPIYITDYNVEFLLQELEKRDLVKESIGYYGRTDWEAKSKHSIEYLALMRCLRDICVNNAIPFTPMGESKEADTVLTLMGQQMFIHFYEKGTKVETLLGRSLQTIRSGITIVLFKNLSDKKHFQNLMSSSPSVVPLIIKMEIDSSSLILQTTEEIEKMLVEFKSM